MYSNTKNNHTHKHTNTRTVNSNKIIDKYICRLSNLRYHDLTKYTHTHITNTKAWRGLAHVQSRMQTHTQSVLILVFPTFAVRAPY